MAGARSEEDKAASDTVDSILFGFYRPEEVRKLSVKNITKPEVHDMKGSAVPDGVNDPALGPVNDTDSCKTCGQLAAKCPGHCGHVELAKPLFNPLLFCTLKNLLLMTCFNCHKFKCSREKIKRYTCALELIAKGDVSGARSLESTAMRESMFGEEAEEGEDESNFVDESLPNREITKNSEITKNTSWTSLQYAEAHSILIRLMHEKSKKCESCGMKSPKITCPTFGWFNKESKGSTVRSNIISGYGENYSEDPQSEVHNTGEGTGDVNETEKTIGGISEEEVKRMMTAGIQHLLPSEVESIIKDLWKKEPKLCMLLCDIQQRNSNTAEKESGYEMFFLKVLLIPPNKFRPAAEGGGGNFAVFEHPHNALLSKVITANNLLKELSKKNEDQSGIIRSWMFLQRRVTILYDSSKGIGKADRDANGFRQVLEKKSGILRQKMMGKRVNFACRSVISPDPYLAVNEIGIPPYFATRLTYAERVTPWNLKTMREAVMNGADIHPGATHFKDKDGMYKLQMNPGRRYSVSKKLFSSGTAAKQGKGPESDFESKVVFRHMRDGDIVLVNRQPTLHKPSMMAHVVRVLKGEKTIRMHYANCSTYNADFDGDEMNVHFPQDEIARAEAMHIVSANKQYNVPTSGDPIRGLIQDHIACAVLLTKVDTFLTREQYNQLLYGAVLPSYSSNSTQFGGKISIINSSNEIQPLPPAILKPKPLWTGKQVISAVLNYITRGRPPFTVERKGKVPKEFLEDLDRKKGKKGSKTKSNKEPDELTLYIHDNELVKGILDKAQFGKFGIVHAVHELYGADSAGDLLSSFSRLFTLFLQMHGFTCGVDDLLIDPHSDLKRKKILETSEAKSEDVHARFTGIDAKTTDPHTFQKEVEKVIRRNGDSATVGLDRMMCNALNVLTSEVNKTLFPDGLQKPFPYNCLSLMTTTGAKGSLVNMTQISSLLGQQELEGKRVPRMVSGKTLPCFPAWDTSSRSGGFISDRFLTGLRPQEYFFHCMAGRDGLVDTAIKTSRSGYLQRCLIKNLESLKVSYDYTVRDMDGSVIQFTYGEDGVDVQKSSCISEFRLLADNKKALLSKLGGDSKTSSLSRSNKYIKDLPSRLEDEASVFASLPRSKQKCRKDVKEKDLLKILKVKYLASLADPGEPVGIVAAQSIGEPSTQMTLNTFHLAGRGDMNVTLGIPRLQEILMTASKDISTPIMKCPLLTHTSREDAERVAAKLRRICVADVVERMKVCTVPFCAKKNGVSTIYKLEMRLFSRDSFPLYSDLTTDECMQTISSIFVEAMEDAIQKHIEMLNKIRDIKVVVGGRAEREGEGEGGDDESSVKMKRDDGDGSDGEGENDGEDQGADGERRRMQERDEMEYEDDVVESKWDEKRDDVDGDEEKSAVDDVEEKEEDFAMGGVDDVEEKVTVENDEIDGEDIEEEKSSSKKKKKSKDDKNKKKDEKKKSKVVVEKKTSRKRKKVRQIHMEFDGLDFEVHYRFDQDDPRILLAEIAQKTAKTIYIRQSRKIERCSVAEPETADVPPTLQTSGINFEAFWDLDKYINVSRITSNCVHAMLNTYGVEAARATILREVGAVFGAYGIGVDSRHLSLIADFMTFDGGYRPLNRFGVGSYNTSPFGKMTYETATKFIVESAFHGETDRLDCPSASVCLGQPIKMGTGYFDLMQRIDDC